VALGEYWILQEALEGFRRQAALKPYGEAIALRQGSQPPSGYEIQAAPQSFPTPPPDVPAAER